MHTVNTLSLPARRCLLMLEMSGSENILHCPCMAVHLIELSHNLLSSGYAYDSVPPGRAMMERDTHGPCCYMQTPPVGASRPSCPVDGSRRLRDRPLSLGSRTPSGHQSAGGRKWRELT